jgi:hypothetical protein
MRILFKDKSNIINSKMTKHTGKKAKQSTKKAKKELYSGWQRKQYRNGDTYQGDFKNDRRDGWGKLTFNLDNVSPLCNHNWVTFDGQWKRGEPHGYGRLDFSNSAYCTGTWKNGYLTRGRYIYADGECYWGDIASMYYKDLFYVTPYRNGLGTMFKQNGDVQYQGDWASDPVLFSLDRMPQTKKHGVPHGHGTYYFSRKQYVGVWKWGIPSNEGIHFHKNGEIETKQFPCNTTLNWEN